MKTKLLVLSAALMLVVSGCNTSNKSEFTPNTSASTTETSSSSSEEQVTHVTGVSLDQASVDLKVGQSVTLVATVAPSNATNKNVTWSATGSGIVSVDNGVVTGEKTGQSVVTVTTADGGFTAQCVVTVNAKDQKPQDAVDLEYSTADDLGKHGDNYVYFNDPSWWSGASAKVNEAYSYNENKNVVFDYTYLDRDDPSAPYQNWTVQLMRKNTSLTEGKNYDLSLKINLNKAGKIILNDVTKDVVEGDNELSVTYTQGGGYSINIQFPMGMIGNARALLSDVKWEEHQSGGEQDGALPYATADTLSQHGDDYCYFNNPEWWEGGHADVNEATYSKGVLTFDYTYDSKSAETSPDWTVQLMRKNTSLTAGKQYTLSFKMNSNVAGRVVVNNQNKTLIAGDNNISVDYEETAGASFNIQFPFKDFGSAKVIITNIEWNEKGSGGGSGGGEQGDIKAPEGVVVNPVAEGYIVAFAAVDGATGYKAYYVNAETGTDVDNEAIAAPGAALTKVASLADGKYKVYVTTLKDEQESARSTSFGEFQKGGEVEPVAPVGIVVSQDGQEKWHVAFAAVAGATGYKAYYVDSNGQDVGNHEVTNGGFLTLADTLAAGTYKIYVSTLVGEKESSRSEGFGTLTIA